MENVAIFASGEGSNTENLIRHFRNHSQARISLVVSDRKDAPVLNKARAAGIESHFIRYEKMATDDLFRLLKEKNITLILLAGYLRLIPQTLIHQFHNRIINIHPALLPKFGGKGMYGDKVHEAVIKAGEKKSGITIHYVNEHFDQGEIIAQFELVVEKNETPESLKARIRELELKHYPLVIENIISRLQNNFIRHS